MTRPIFSLTLLCLALTITAAQAAPGDCCYRYALGPEPFCDGSWDGEANTCQTPLQAAGGATAFVSTRAYTPTCDYSCDSHKPCSDFDVAGRCNHGPGSGWAPVHNQQIAAAAPAGTVNSGISGTQPPAAPGPFAYAPKAKACDWRTFSALTDTGSCRRAGGNWRQDSGDTYGDATCHCT